MRGGACAACAACVRVQAQLGDALGDVAVAKRREEGVRSEAQKLTARLSAAQVIVGFKRHTSKY